MQVQGQKHIESAGKWLVSAGGTATPGDLGRAIGFHRNRQAAVIASLRSAGLADGPKGLVRLTPAGWARFAGAGPIGAGEVIDQVVNAVYPERFYAHRALQRLYLSAVVARWHLHEKRTEGHLSFVSRGDEGTGKTAVYRLSAEMLGIDPTEVTIGPDDETAASTTGRRSNTGGTWERESPAAAGSPLIILDDIDKMTWDERKALWLFFREKTRQRTEGGTRVIRPTAAVTFNPISNRDPDTMLPTGWARRSVLLDADYARSERGDLRRSLEAYYRPGRDHSRERLNLGSLVPPAIQLDDAALDVIESATHVFVDSDRAWPKTGLELAALGRLALLGDGDHIRASVVTLVDYITVCSTSPGVVADDWPARAHGFLEWEATAGRSEVRAAIDAYSAAADRAAAAARTRRIARAVESDDLTYDRSSVVARLGESIAALDSRKLRTWPLADRVRAKALRDVLVKLRTEAGNTKTAASLEAVRERARPRLGEADALVAAARQAQVDKEAEAAQLALESRRAVEARNQSRQEQKRNERAQRKHAAEQARRLTWYRKALESKRTRTSTRKNEDVLKWLVDQGVVQRQQYIEAYEVAPIVPNGVRAFFGVTPGQVQTRQHRVTVYLDRSGRKHQPDALRAWESPATRSALAAAIERAGMPSGSVLALPAGLL